MQIRRRSISFLFLFVHASYAFSTSAYDTDQGDSPFVAGCVIMSSDQNCKNPLSNQHLYGDVDICVSEMVLHEVVGPASCEASGTLSHVVYNCNDLCVSKGHSWGFCEHVRNEPTCKPHFQNNFASRCTCMDD